MVVATVVATVVGWLVVETVDGRVVVGLVVVVVGRVVVCGRVVVVGLVVVGGRVVVGLELVVFVGGAAVVEPVTRAVTAFVLVLSSDVAGNDVASLDPGGCADPPSTVSASEAPERDEDPACTPGAGLARPAPATPPAAEVESSISPERRTGPASDSAVAGPRAGAGSMIWSSTTLTPTQATAIAILLPSNHSTMSPTDFMDRFCLGGAKAAANATLKGH